MESQTKAIDPVIPWNGCFTLKNEATGAYRTFEIATQPDDAIFAPGSRIISLLTGPDNTADYKSFGFVHDRLGVRVWKKLSAVSLEWDKLADMVNHLVAGFPLYRSWDLSGYTVLIEKRCRRCNRRLTTPQSIEAGIGPICAGRE